MSKYRGRSGRGLAGRTGQRHGLAGFLNWMFVDRRTGRLVIGQTPNAAMLVFIAACAARPLVSPRRLPGTTVRLAQGGSLFFWAADELLRGVNPFRRIGGAVVLCATPFRRLIR